MRSGTLEINLKIFFFTSVEWNCVRWNFFRPPPSCQTVAKALQSSVWLMRWTFFAAGTSIELLSGKLTTIGIRIQLMNESDERTFVDLFNFLCERTGNSFGFFIKSTIRETVNGITFISLGTLDNYDEEKRGRIVQKQIIGRLCGSSHEAPTKLSY